MAVILKNGRGILNVCKGYYCADEARKKKREMWVILVFVIWIVLVFINYMTVNYCSFFLLVFYKSYIPAMFFGPDQYRLTIC